MANKARLRFQPIDHSYAARYGKMPDYDFTDRLKAGEPLEKVSALINSRLAAIWAEEKRHMNGRKHVVTGRTWVQSARFERKERVWKNYWLVV